VELALKPLLLSTCNEVLSRFGRWALGRFNVGYPTGIYEPISRVLSSIGPRLRVADSFKLGHRRMIRLGACVITFWLSTCARTQETPTASPSDLLRRSQSTDTVQASAQKAVQAQSPASLSGTVLDQGGAAVPGVRVTLVTPGDMVPHVATTDTSGAFTLMGLPPGTYQVKIDGVGIEPFASETVVLDAGAKPELPILASRLPTKNTTLDVTATLNDVAREQVHEQEQQRILGFFPNYYTSYIWTAAPMTTKLKFELAFRTATDPVKFLVVAGVAGIEQGHNTFPGYGGGWEGYAKRYGASYADTVADRMFGSAIFPAMLHQDPRYFYRGSGTTRSRLFYALASTFVCRGDSGLLEPNYSHVLGSFAAAGISNLYRAPQDRQASLTFRNGLVITASGAVVNILREFVSRKLTSSVPAFANGKP
jgi:hypothetical protein